MLSIEPGSVPRPLPDEHQLSSELAARAPCRGLLTAPPSPSPRATPQRTLGCRVPVGRLLLPTHLAGEGGDQGLASLETYTCFQVIV